MTVNERIEKIANEVFEEYGGGIPVNPITISRNIGIEVYEAILKPDEDGILKRDDDKWSIYIDRKHYPRRKRFSIAHELGHYYLHQMDAPTSGMLISYRDSVSSKTTNPKEIEANAFASALLMNKGHVENLWADYKSVQFLADQFKVSNEAMGYRLKNLGLI